VGPFPEAIVRIVLDQRQYVTETGLVICSATIETADAHQTVNVTVKGSNAFCQVGKH